MLTVVAVSQCVVGYAGDGYMLDVQADLQVVVSTKTSITPCDVLYCSV